MKIEEYQDSTEVETDRSMKFRIFDGEHVQVVSITVNHSKTHTDNTYAFFQFHATEEEIQKIGEAFLKHSNRKHKICSECGQKVES